MLLLPIEAKPLLDLLKDEIKFKCSLEVGAKNLPFWRLTVAANKLLSALLDLNCMPDDMTIAKIATAINDGNFEFDGSLNII